MTRVIDISEDNIVDVTLLLIRLSLPGCKNLKEKRGRILTIITRLRKKFNMSVAETGLQDYWQSCLISCAIVSNDAVHNRRIAEEMIRYIELNHPDEQIDEYAIEKR